MEEKFHRRGISHFHCYQQEIHQEREDQEDQRLQQDILQDDKAEGKEEVLCKSQNL